MTRRVRNMTDASLAVVLEAPASGDGRLSLWRIGPSGPRMERMTTLAPGAMVHAVEESNAGRVTALLASGQARCRVCELPNAPEPQLATALMLQAESMQLGSVPSHRSRHAVLPMRPGAARSGVIVEWPTSETAPPLPATLRSSQQVTFSADVSALAALASVPGVRGPLLLIDAERGMVAFALMTAKGMALRSARENLRDGDDALVRLVAETALHQGVDGSEIERLVADVRAAATVAAGSGFGCTAEDRARLAAAIGGSDDPAWWRSSALHAGTALALAGPLAPLTALLAHEPGEEPNAIGRVLNRLAEPRVLGWTLIAALIAIAFGPLAITWSDYWIMRWKVRDTGVDKLRAVVAENDRMLALYRERSARTWPMSKLLADLACCTPEGIELDQINIVQGESVSVRGRAIKTDQISQEDTVLRMERLMQESRIFSKINKGWDALNNLGVLQFSLSAAVTAPTVPIAPAEGQDWAKMTLAQKKYPSLRTATASGQGDASAAPSTDDGATEIASAAESGGTDGATTPPDGSVALAGAGKGEAALPQGRRGPTGSATVPADGAAARGAEAGSAPKPGDPIAHGTTGEDAAAKGEDESASDRERRPVGGGSSRSDDRGLASTGKPGESNERTRGAGPAAAPIDVAPDPLSDEQISAMSKEEALAAASAVAKARSNVAFDDATRERLRNEFFKLMAQVRAKS